MTINREGFFWLGNLLLTMYVGHLLLSFLGTSSLLSHPQMLVVVVVIV